MPMNMNVGLSKKVGEANYGSRGATVNLESEVDSALVNDPPRLRERIRQMFHLARDAIQEELSGSGTNGHAGSSQHNNGHNQNGNQRDRAATDAQCRVLRTIAQRQNRDLGQLLNQRFNCNQPEQITLRQASELIDQLNASNTGSPL